METDVKEVPKKIVKMTKNLFMGSSKVDTTRPQNDRLTVDTRNVLFLLKTEGPSPS